MDEKVADTWEEPVFNEETRKAIEDMRRGIGMSKAYNSVAELFAALDAEEDDEEEKEETTKTSLRGV